MFGNSAIHVNACIFCHRFLLFLSVFLNDSKKYNFAFQKKSNVRLGYTDVDVVHHHVYQHHIYYMLLDCNGSK